jgi:dipeptidyl aminopeptidase/acylaminoacyl peptidase
MRSLPKLGALITLGALATVVSRAAEPVGPGQLARAARFLTLPARVAGGRIADPKWLPDGSLTYTRVTTAGPRTVRVQLRNGQTEVSDAPPPPPAPPSAEEAALRARQAPRPVGTRFPHVAFGPSTIFESVAPDANSLLGVRDHELWLRFAREDSSRQLTHDGNAELEWDIEGVKWSSDGRFFAIVRLDNTNVTKLPMVRWLSPTPTVSFVPIATLGTPLPRYSVFIGDVSSGTVREVDTAERESNLGVASIHYSLVGFVDDDRKLLVTKTPNDRSSGRLVEIDAATGNARTLITETTNTVLMREAPELVPTLLTKSRKLIWKSDRDGWMQLYLQDMNGRLLRQLTTARYPVDDVVYVDESKRRVYFTASPDEARPYDKHLMEVSLDGGRVRQLSEAPGQHRVRFSPDGSFYLDEYSSPATPPVTELRAADGRLVRVLEQSSTDPRALWEGQPPEEFSVLAADGKTRLYGILYKPADFDPSRRYPVVQFVYGGPGVVISQHQFIPSAGMLPPALAQLGFVTFTLDSRGTPGRSKAFQDAAFHDIGTHQIDDYLAALKQLGARYAYLDMSRVGVFGRSFGGYTTLRAMLLAPDVYRVGVAGSPMTGDEKFCEGLINGLPPDSEPAQRARVIPLVNRLNGRLLIMTGTHDAEIPFDLVMKLVSAFEQAGKRIDMMVLPEANHFYRNEGSFGVPDSAPYAVMDRSREATRIFDYFVEHLLNGVRPPLQLPREPQRGGSQ